MKDKRVKICNRVGTVIANPHRYYDKGEWNRYCEVLFDDTGYIESVRIESLEVI